MVVLSEDSFVDPNSVNGHELRRIAETARLFGCRVYPVPPDFADCETAENALAHVPHFTPELPGILVAYIPTFEHYAAIFEAARAKRGSARQYSR